MLKILQVVKVENSNLRWELMGYHMTGCDPEPKFWRLSEYDTRTADYWPTGGTMSLEEWDEK